VTLLFAWAAPNPLALAEGPSQPEALQFEPVDATDMVNLATGDFTYNLPLLAVPGPAGNFPVNLSYHAGIGPHQDATWVGLGWSLNPGAVNRTISGYPDDYDGDLVQTHFEAQTRSGYGVGIGIGYGPFGLNFQYDSHTGAAGVNAFASVPLMALGPASAPFGGVGFTIGTSGVSLGGSMGFGGPFAAGVSIGLGDSTVGFSGDIKLAGNPLIGFSLSSAEQASISIAGAGFSSMAVSTRGQLTSSSRSFGLPLPPLGLWLGVSHSEWRWTLDDTYEERSYGYVHQRSYLQDFGSVSEKKYERQRQGRFAYPSQDAYTVHAQGVSGTFMPFQRKAYSLVDGPRNTDKAQLRPLYDTFFNRGTNDVVFRFLGDPGANFVADDGRGRADARPWGGDDENLFDQTVGSRPITARVDSTTSKIVAFEILDRDGTRYEFAQTVMALFQYSWTANRVEESESYAALGTPYAVNWLLTAVRGPDYVDRNADGAVGDGDWGYWARLRYQAASKPQIWRSPYSGDGPAGYGDDTVEGAIGARESVYLDSIETATHLAKFRRSTPKDRWRADAGRNIELRGKWLAMRNSAGRVEHDFGFGGDWTQLLNESPDGVVIVEAALSCSFGSTDDDSFVSANYDRTATRGQLLGWRYDGFMTIVTLEDQCNGRPGAFTTSGRLHVDELIGAPYNVSARLDRIDLYGKLDPGLRRDAESGIWRIDAARARPLRSVRLGYDYSLCARTPTSRATGADGGAGGKLTLRSVEFLGRDGTASAPPHRFEYGFNPWYERDAWDRWGFYRAPVVGRAWVAGQHRHAAHQQKLYADMALAWSLNKITLPTGGAIEIEYERDDYYSVSDYFDLDELEPIVRASPVPPAGPLELHAQGPVTVGPGNRVLIPSSLGLPTTPVRAGDYLLLFEVYDVNSRAYWREIEVYGRRVIQARETSSGLVVEFDGPAIAWKLHAPTVYKYYARPLQKRVFGGGLRVRSLAAVDGETRYETLYRYEDEDGFSTGVTAALPAPYGPHRIGKFRYGTTVQVNPSGGDPYRVRYRDWDRYRRQFLSHETSYGRPGPGVIYGRVDVIPVDGDDRPVSGRSEYGFYTARDHPYRTRDAGATFDIDDPSAIYAKPKYQRQHEEPQGNVASRPVSLVELFYAFSDRMRGAGKIRHPTVIANLERKPLGIAVEKYAFETTEYLTADEDLTRTESRRVSRRYQSVYVTDSVSTAFTYPAPGEGGAPAELTQQTTYFQWDARNGQSLAEASPESDRRVRITRGVPAHWKYSDMRSANLLSQIALSATHLAPPPWVWGRDGRRLVLDLYLESYAFPAGDITRAEATTWSRSWGGPALPWRINDRYVYDASRDDADGRRDLMNADLWTDETPALTLSPATASRPWHMVDNVTAYSEWSEWSGTRAADGTFIARSFDAAEGTLVAISSNAEPDQVRYASFESDLGPATMAPGHTGARARRVEPRNAGVTAPVVAAFPVKAGRGYVVSYWIRMGTAAISDGVSLAVEGLASRSWSFANSVEPSGTWKRIEHTFTPAEDGAVSLRVSLSSSQSVGHHLLDDLRLHPADALIKTYSYEAGTKLMTAASDENDRATRYELDPHGRLVVVRDADGNVTTRHRYEHRN
jgi:YD repeat-containing protein